MPQYEYKVIKIPHNQQQFYCSHLGCFGWQVQNIQESVDRVVNTSLGFSHNTNYGHFDARTYFPSHTNHMNTYGSSRSHGWGSQMNTSVTNVHTSLTITFFRDMALPYRSELIEAENHFHAAAKSFLARVNRENNWGNDSWPERKAAFACSNAGSAILRRKPATPIPQVAAPQPQTNQPTPSTISKTQPPAQVPSTPATGAIREMEVVHNVFQSNQAGMQIRLNFNIQKRKGIPCRMIVYFFDSERKPLKDVNQRFRTQEGNVSVGSVFTPGYDETFYNNYILFMPYSELDQKDGARDLGFYAQLFDEAKNSILATSPYALFRYTQKGQTMRGEARVTPPPAVAAPQTAQQQPKAAGKNRPSQPPALPAAAKPPSRAEYLESFRKKSGWDVLTKDRKLYLEGFSLAMDRKNTQAQKLYKQALDLNPKESRYWLAVSGEYLEKGEFDAMIQFLRKGLKQLPGDPFILKMIAHAHIRKAELDQAQSIAAELGSQKDDSSKIQYNYLEGELAEARQDYKTAIRFYDRADALITDPETKSILGFNQERCRRLIKEKKNSGN